MLWIKLAENYMDILRRSKGMKERLKIIRGVIIFTALGIILTAVTVAAICSAV